VGATRVRDLLYFQAHDGTTGTELWRSDGTKTGTAPVADINPDLMGFGPVPRGSIGRKLFFSAVDGTNGEELWKTKP
jgi:ELWxxDGT repeat protein